MTECDHTSRSSKSSCSAVGRKESSRIVFQAMSLFISTWSVASAFNRWNDDGVYGDWVVNIEQDIELSTQFQSRHRVNIVAAMIRELGYSVTCGEHRCEGAMISYIIMNIQNAVLNYLLTNK